MISEKLRHTHTLLEKSVSVRLLWSVELAVQKLCCAKRASCFIAFCVSFEDLRSVTFASTYERFNLLRIWADLREEEGGEGYRWSWHRSRAEARFGIGNSNLESKFSLRFSFMHAELLKFEKSETLNSNN